MVGTFWIAAYSTGSFSKETPNVQRSITQHPGFRIVIELRFEQEQKKQSRVATEPFLPNVPRFHRV